MVQIMAWRRPGHYLPNVDPDLYCPIASLGCEFGEQIIYLHLTLCGLVSHIVPSGTKPLPEPLLNLSSNVL